MMEIEIYTDELPKINEGRVKSLKDAIVEFKAQEFRERYKKDQEVASAKNAKKKRVKRKVKRR